MKKYALLIGAGLLLLLNSCDKEPLELTPDQISLERIFLEADDDTTKRAVNWDKRYDIGEEPPTNEPDNGFANE